MHTTLDRSQKSLRFADTLRLNPSSTRNYEAEFRKISEQIHETCEHLTFRTLNDETFLFDREASTLAYLLRKIDGLTTKTPTSIYHRRNIKRRQHILKGILYGAILNAKLQTLERMLSCSVDMDLAASRNWADRVMALAQLRAQEHEHHFGHKIDLTKLKLAYNEFNSKILTAPQNESLKTTLEQESVKEDRLKTRKITLLVAYIEQFYLYLAKNIGGLWRTMPSFLGRKQHAN